LTPSLRWPVPLGPKSEIVSPCSGHTKRPRPAAVISASVGGGLLPMIWPEDGGGVTGWAETGPLGGRG
jgi:hypothetical protein